MVCGKARRNQSRGMLGLVCWIGVAGGMFAAEPAVKPATLAEARKMLSLDMLPQLPAKQPPAQATIAQLSYSTTSPIAAAAEFYAKLFAERGWKELDGGYRTDQYVSATYSKAGFNVSLSITPQGAETGVTLINHGNVDLAKLPVPDDAQPLFAGPVSRMVFSSQAPDVVKAALQKKLEAAGWVPYGVAGDSLYFKQNAVRLGALVSIAPAQGNKTMIQWQSELMSLDVPVPSAAEGVQYANVTKTVSFDAPMTIDEVAAFYRAALKTDNWQATTEQPVKVGFRFALIFRNPVKELIDVTMQKVGDKTRALVKFQTAEEVAAEDARAKAAATQAATGTPVNMVKLTLPAETQQTSATRNSVEMKVKSGAAQQMVARWKADLEKEGWKGDKGVNEPQAGSFTMERGGQTLSFTYLDPGFIPGEITVRLIGGELSPEPAKKP